MGLEKNFKNFLDKESQKQSSILKNERTENNMEYNKRMEEKMEWIEHIMKNNEWIITDMEGKIEGKTRTGRARSLFMNRSLKT